MKQLSFICYSFLLFILASCSSNEEPDDPVVMQPSSITTTDANGDNQTFEYDEYGRIVVWKLESNSPSNPTSYTAHYSYPKNNTIKVKSEEFSGEIKRYFEETIQLVNGRATKSEGTFLQTYYGHTEARKTYRLEFNYSPSNHLNAVKHSEVMGIGDDITNDAWNNAWTWENYLIWEDGNLKEFQDFQGHSSIYQTTRYEYSTYSVAYPIIIPAVIDNAHHIPLCMQGVFGSNSVNLVAASSMMDRNGNLYLSHQYSYAFEQSRIVEFVETTSDSSNSSNPISYNVNWTE